MKKTKITNWDDFYFNCIPHIKKLIFRGDVFTTKDKIESEAIDAYLLGEEIEYSY